MGTLLQKAKTVKKNPYVAWLWVVCSSERSPHWIKSVHFSTVKQSRSADCAQWWHFGRHHVFRGEYRLVSRSPFPDHVPPQCRWLGGSQAEVWLT